MITPMSMQDGLNDFLKKRVTSKQKLKAVDREGNTVFKHPQIIRSGWVMPKSADDESSADEDFPYIITRIEKIEHVKGARHSVVTMLIIYGIYDPGTYDDDGMRIDDGSGYRDFWNLVEVTRQALFQQQIIDNKYRVHDDFYEAEPLPIQEYPYWQGFCRVKLDVLFPVPKLDEHFYTKGD